MQERLMPKELHQALKKWINQKSAEEENPSPLPRIDQRRVLQRQMLLRARQQIVLADISLWLYGLYQGVQLVLSIIVGPLVVGVLAIPYLYVIFSPRLTAERRFGQFLAYELLIQFLSYHLSYAEWTQLLPVKLVFIILALIGYRAAQLNSQLNPLFRPPSAQVVSLELANRKQSA